MLKCKNCNECCSVLLPLNSKEIKLLKKTIKKKKIKKQNILMPTTCPLSDKNKKCLAYEQRPEICKQYHCKKEVDSCTMRTKGYYIYNMNDLFKEN